MSDLPLRDKFRGALLGAAIGDALGAAFEGWSRVSAEVLNRVEQADDVLRWTDDTHMTLATADSLIAAGGFDGEDMAERFVAAHAREPWRGYGAGPPQVFAAIRAGAPWHEPAALLFGGAGSYGNGGAMRAAPAGLLAFSDLEVAAQLARSCAAITHTHELGLQGAALQAAAVAWLVSTEPAERWDGGQELLTSLRRIAPAEEYQAKLEALIGLPGHASSDEAAKRLGNGIAAVEAVPAALWAFLRHRGSFAEAVRAAILMAGDTDTIGAMTGALSGAHLGASAIPPRWIERVEAAQRITALADQLCAAAAGRLSAVSPD